MSIIDKRIADSITEHLDKYYLKYDGIWAVHKDLALV